MSEPRDDASEEMPGRSHPEEQEGRSGLRVDRARPWERILIFLLVALAAVVGLGHTRTQGNGELQENASPERQASRSDNKIKRNGSGKRIFAVLFLVLLAAGLGLARAQVYNSSQPLINQELIPCENLAGSKISETLNIHVGAQPLKPTITETVTLPASNQYAQDLISTASRAKVSSTAKCIFSHSVYGTPRLMSVARGMATFSETSQLPLLDIGAWRTHLYYNHINFTYDPTQVCNSSPDANWAQTTLDLNVVTNATKIISTPVPSVVYKQNYSWHSPAGSCAKLGQVSLRIPISIPEYVSTVISQSRPSVAWIIEAIGWLDPIILVLAALWLARRARRTGIRVRRTSLLIRMTALSLIPAVVYLTGVNDIEGSAELVASYIVMLSIALILRSAAPGHPDNRNRRASAMLAAGAVTGTAILIGAFIYSDRINSARHSYVDYQASVNQAHTASFILIIVAAILLIIIGAALLSAARHVPVKDDTGIRQLAWLNMMKQRDLLVFLSTAVLAIALAYSIGTVIDFSPGQSIISSGFFVLRYPLAVLATSLAAIALVAPVARAGQSSDNALLAMAAFGFAIATQQSDLLIFGLQLPLGTILFAYLVYRLIVRTRSIPCDKSSSEVLRLRSCMPYGESPANAVLAIKISAAIAVIPTGYFIYSTATSLPARLQQPGPGIVFVVEGIFSQFTGWILIGIFLGLLNVRLPGRAGPVRALVLSGVWFGTALIIQIVNNWYLHSDSRSWIFPGLQLLLFMVAFSVAWDACILRQHTLKGTFDALKLGYRIQETRTIALYAIPVIITIIAIGQQVASGSSAEFVKSALTGFAAILGG